MASSSGTDLDLEGATLKDFSDDAVLTNEELSYYLSLKNR